MAWKNDCKTASAHCLLLTRSPPRRSVQVRIQPWEKRGRKSPLSSMSRQKPQFPLQPLPRKRIKSLRRLRTPSIYKMKSFTIHSRLPVAQDRWSYPIPLWIFSFPALMENLSTYSTSQLYVRNTGEDSFHGPCQWLSVPLP